MIREVINKCIKILSPEISQIEHSVITHINIVSYVVASFRNIISDVIKYVVSVIPLKVPKSLALNKSRV